MMTSFSFPKMFNQTTANIVENKDAIRQNMLLLMSSERSTLFGDPYYGCQLKKYIFEQSASLVVDLLIDEFYTTIISFMPQVYLTRKDIDIFVSGTGLYARISYTYTLDNSRDLFTIKLTEAAED